MHLSVEDLHKHISVALAREGTSNISDKPSSASITGSTANPNDSLKNFGWQESSDDVPEYDNSYSAWDSQSQEGYESNFYYLWITTGCSFAEQKIRP